MAKNNTRLSSQDKLQIQKLYRYNVAPSVIAKHFSVSAPTISYHTNFLTKLPLEDVLTSLQGESHEI